MYLYTSDTLIWLFLEILYILFFFALTIYWLDGFNISTNKLIKNLQITVFIIFIITMISVIISTYLSDFTLYDSISLKINQEDAKNVTEKVTLQGKVVLDKDAGTQVAKGVSNLGSNLGLAGCVGALTASVAKVITKSPLPPVQKAGFVVVGGIIGAGLHTGASAINAQTHKLNDTTKHINSSDKKEIMEGVNKFLDSDFANDNTPLQILLQCISILNSASLWLIIVLVIQTFFKFYISDRPPLKFLDYMLPGFNYKIKEYIYKLIYINKKMNTVYMIIAYILLFISILGSGYFAWELNNNLSQYVDTYISIHKK